jgi:hypothetical protein
MGWRRIGAVVGVLLALAGCGVGPPLQDRLAPWVGRSEADLVSAFGVPAGTYEVDGRKFLQFEQRRTQIIPSDPFPYRGYGRFGPLWSPSPGYIVVGCDITFALRRGVVDSFSFRGDGCR